MELHEPEFAQEPSIHFKLLEADRTISELLKVLGNRSQTNPSRVPRIRHEFPRCTEERLVGSDY
jgi:hypothetical protein